MDHGHGLARSLKAVAIKRTNPLLGALLGLTVLVTAACTGSGRAGSTTEDPMLDALLSASSDKAFNEALRDHGRIRVDEIPTLQAAAEGWSSKRRRNAVTALTLVDDPAALSALRQHAADTRDVEEWALAMRALLEEADADTSAKSRPDMVTRAMQDGDPAVRAVGLDAAFRAGREDAIAALEEELGSKEKRDDLRLTEVISRLSPGPFEARLRALYEKEPDSIVSDALVTALSRGTDPATGPVIQARLQAMYLIDCGTTLVALGKGTAPWVRPTLLIYAAYPTAIASWALGPLSDGGPAADWIGVCVNTLEGRPGEGATPDELDAYERRIDPCEEALSTVAGQKLQGEAALSWARTWLAAQGGGGQ